MDSYDKISISKEDSEKIDAKVMIFSCIMFVVVALILLFFTHAYVKSIFASAFLTFISAFFYYGVILSNAFEKAEKEEAEKIKSFNEKLVSK